jgi:aminocarboxymuconate-semialdehyde decarboxylase
MNRPSMNATPRSIDVHAHVVLPELMGRAGSHGPEMLEHPGEPPRFRVGRYTLEGVRYRDTPFTDLSLRIAAMDRAGIERQVLSPNPLTYFHHLDAATALAFCRQHNDALAALVARQPERLAGFAAVPIQEPALAAAELRRAVTELGLLGPYIGTSVGRPLDAPALDVFYAACTALDVPLFLHPAPAGIDGPPGDPRLGRFEFELLLGFAAEETLAAATLIFGGVLARHPRLDVCLSHGGGALAALAPRLAAAARKRAWVPEALRPDGAFEAALARLWFDVHVHDRRVLALLESLVGSERLVLGTNFAGWDQDDGTVLGDAARQVLLAANAQRLLRWPGAAPGRAGARCVPVSGEDVRRRGGEGRS